ncbi:AAA family ATPase [Halorubrum lacusprofundi]|jgi:MoxR-like ATPase|uniref:ATPase associated with various cellular activities AAA_3 n=1 Tax=Halorubrum lacusprofundi (strain ATCC 49239 / DSM 5036 / JCM 8891 / ACAM 34) TaxID=416348 RepID=B9LSU0_HALLT|nr:MoxR family ATPase [Halorubrum lacusprofundi]ACM56005.1 ATPase associated with various cellular activities AAA_3 [Halorubrum lacusprofundi ATCC 49239]
MDPATVQQRSDQILDGIASVVVSERSTLKTVLVGLLSDGHILLEDVPGTGKTLTARSFANAVDVSFSRVQFTPDLLPSDVIGSNVFDEKTQSFEFQPGPVFANVVLADEINRAPPKTQAALLEAMEEGQVTVDGETHPLPDPFVVIATQNPVEMEGTFELPAAQKDRFIVKTSLGYPDRAGELELIDRRAGRQASSPSVRTVCSLDTLTQLRRAPESIRVEDGVRQYLVDVARATRTDERVNTGVSPRGIQRFFEVVRTHAALMGRSYATPDDVKAMAPPALSHRIVVTPDARVSGVSTTEIVDDILSEIPMPQLRA